MLRRLHTTIGSLGLLLLGACADAGNPGGTGPATDAPLEAVMGPSANSVTRIVGNWQVTITDLGLMPGGTFSTAWDINNLGEVVGIG